MKYVIAMAAVLWLSGNCIAGCADSGCSGCDSCSTACASNSCGSNCATGCSSLGGCSDPGCSSCGQEVSFCTNKSDCCCLKCCCQWRLVAELLFLRRGDADNYALITDQVGGGEILNAENLEFDHEVAPRVVLIRDLDNCWGWDIGYIGLDSWEAVGQGGDPVSPALRGPGGVPFASAQAGTIFGVEYTSEFHSAEFNIRRRCNECLTWLAGFRAVELSDNLRAGQIATAQQLFYNVDTNNHMYGFQIGADAQILHCQERFHVDGIFRAAVLGNNADQATDVPVIPATAFASDDHTAFLGEFGLRGVYDLNRRMAITGGYHLIYLDGVALAPNQLATTSLGGTSTLDTSSLLLHGAAVGLRFTY